MKPLIGINLDISAGPPPEASVQLPYLQAIERAGGIPLLIPPIDRSDLKRVLELVDGVMLIGGLDYCPSLYGEETGTTVQLIDPLRQAWDLALAKQLLEERQLPVLGICGGCQLLNICLGGSLVQDIKTALPDTTVVHSKPNGWTEGFAQHTVRLEQGSLLERIYESSNVNVPTSHHQAVKIPGDGARITAYAEDGVIEAVEISESPFVVGVQWHPERDFDMNAPLFRWFVRSAAEIAGVRRKGS